MKDGLERFGASKEGRVGVFAIFDAENDGDLYQRLYAQSDHPGCGFRVISGSERDTEAGRERVRRRIRDADQVIVICGEHAEASPRIHAELLIARDEKKPYFLLWGRRGVMCTKPVGAKPSEGMYSWTQQFLHDQLAINRRRGGTNAEARSLAKESRTVRRSASSGADAAAG